MLRRTERHHPGEQGGEEEGGGTHETGAADRSAMALEREPLKVAALAKDSAVPVIVSFGLRPAEQSAGSRSKAAAGRASEGPAYVTSERIGVGTREPSDPHARKLPLQQGQGRLWLDICLG